MIRGRQGARVGLEDLQGLLEMPGCADFGGPPDYPCDEIKTECDVMLGAGVTITGNFGATNKRCELFGGNRYIIQGEPDLTAAFKCIATVGAGPKGSLPMRSMMAAVASPMVYNGGCNEGFLRKDALLAVVILNGDQDTLTPGTPQDWYDALVAAKKGNEEAIVTLVLGQLLEPGDLLRHLRVALLEELQLQRQMPGVQLQRRKCDTAAWAGGGWTRGWRGRRGPARAMR